MPTLNPQVDLAFKKIFGVEENKDLLISLINSIVSEQDQIADVTLLNPYNPRNFKNDKLSVLDIKARGVNGHLFNIEVQITDVGSYDKRALYYWARLYTQQLKKGEHYSRLKKAIGIHILNFRSINKNEDYHNCFRIKSDKTGETRFEDLELHTIELKKFKPYEVEEVDKLIEKVKTTLDLWVAFLTRYDLLDADNLPKKPNQGAVNKALDVMEHMNLSDEERDEYEEHLKWFRDEAAAIETAEKRAKAKGRARGLAKGRAEGMAEGLEEGLAEGRAEGMAEGMAEGRAEGLLEGRAEGLEEGIVKGREEGIVKGREEGIVKGREEGIVKGRAEGKTIGETEAKEKIAFAMLSVK